MYTQKSLAARPNHYDVTVCQNAEALIVRKAILNALKLTRPEATYRERVKIAVALYGQSYLWSPTSGSKARQERARQNAVA